MNLNKKLEASENFYNFNRPHGAFNGKTPYETLKCLLVLYGFCLGGYELLHPSHYQQSVNLKTLAN